MRILRARHATLVLGLLLTPGCAARSWHPSVREESCLRSFEIDLCTFESVVVPPIETRLFSGLLVSEGADPAWSADEEVGITLRAVWDSQLQRTVGAAMPSGAFSVAALPAGDYCYQVHVSPLGWECVEGIVRIRTDGPSRNSRIVVPFGK